MRPSRNTRRLERALSALADRQDGIVDDADLFGLGFSRDQVKYRLALGRLHRIHPGVYAVGRRRLTREGVWLAAVRACGPGALLGYRSAGAKYGTVADLSNGTEILTTASRHSQERILVHRTRSLHPDDRMNLDGIPITSWARTMLDLADVLTPDRLERALDESEYLRLFDLNALHAAIERSPGRRGRKTLCALLAKWDHASPTRSDLEDRFLELCADHGLPKPHTNTTVCGFDVDALFADRKLIVELDGAAAHRTRSRFESDRVRDAKLQIAGYRVVRITWRRLRDEPAEVAADLRALLAINP
ncbi:MAG: DUF559 domain-containing protein [Solirubrobacterales bacterium]